MEIVTESEKQTEEVAKDFARSLKGGELIALFGDLGAGKSVFTRGLARGLGIKERIASPTFVFIKTHKRGKITLHHIDLYRLHNTQDVEGLGLEDIIAQDNAVVVVEWADKMGKNLPKKRIDISLEKIDDQKRRIRITRH